MLVSSKQSVLKLVYRLPSLSFHKPWSSPRVDPTYQSDLLCDLNLSNGRHLKKGKDGLLFSGRRFARLTRPPSSQPPVNSLHLRRLYHLPPYMTSGNQSVIHHA